MARMNDEARKAYEELDRAIERVRLALEPGLSNILGDWIVVAVEHDIDSPEVCTYSRLFRSGSLPYHVSIGLLQTGLELTQDGDADE